MPETRHAQVTQRHPTQRLLSALTRYGQAKTAADHARDTLEDRRLALIRAGQDQPRERCSADEREACLHGQLQNEIKAVRETRDQLREAELDLESARVQERAAREDQRRLSHS